MVLLNEYTITINMLHHYLTSGVFCALIFFACGLQLHRLDLLEFYGFFPGTKYEETIHQYSVRMKDNVFTYGCGVISAYAIFAERDMNRIEQWEDNPQNFEIVNTVVQIADEYGLDIAKQPTLFDALGNLVGSGDETIIEDFEAALNKTNRWERKMMNSEPERILYMMWATQLKYGGSAKEILDTYDKLMQDIPLDFLPAALILDGQIENAYHYPPSNRLELIKKIVDDYSTEFLKRVAGNRMALPNVIFLLQPQSSEIPNSQSITNEEIEHIRKDYVTGIKLIAEHIEQQTKDIGIAMEAASFFAPYILDAMKEGNSVRMIVAYLQDQISTPAFSAYLSKLSECTEDDFVAYLGQFFRFLAPHHEDNGNVIEYLQHNLARIVRWYIEDKDTFHQWMEQTQNPDDFIRNISWLPYYREQLAPRGREMLSNLLLQLSGSVDDNANFIVAIMRESKYFERAQTDSDSYAIVTPSEEVNDQSAPKYRYILTTPFPSKSDLSVFKQFVNNQRFYTGYLNSLQSKSVEDLEQHNFTKLEKLDKAYKTADNIITLISIAATPVTGGTSILLVASRIAAKKAAQKGLKYGLKVGYHYAKSTVDKNIRNSTSKLIKPDNMWREIKELGGFSQKRGRPSQYARGQDELSKGIDTFNRVTAPIIITFSLSSLAIDMACSQHIEGSNIFLDKMCGNNEEDSQQVDTVCRSFNKRGN